MKEPINMGTYALGSFEEEFGGGIDFMTDILGNDMFAQMTYAEDWKNWLRENIEARVCGGFLILKNLATGTYAKIGLGLLSFQTILIAAKQTSQ